MFCFNDTATTEIYTLSLRDALPISPRPNLIFIVADDLGYAHLGCYGQRKIRTPNLDRMGAEGMRFTNVYAGGCVCAPSRSVTKNGLFSVDNDSPNVSPSALTAAASALDTSESATGMLASTDWPPL